MLLLLLVAFQPTTAAERCLMAVLITLDAGVIATRVVGSVGNEPRDR
jgi:hypothetical protein